MAEQLMDWADKSLDREGQGCRYHLTAHHHRVSKQRISVPPHQSKSLMKSSSTMVPLTQTVEVSSACTGRVEAIRLCNYAHTTFTLSHHWGWRLIHSLTSVYVKKIQCPVGCIKVHIMIRWFFFICYLTLRTPPRRRAAPGLCRAASGLCQHFYQHIHLIKGADARV